MAGIDAKYVSEPQAVLMFYGASDLVIKDSTFQGFSTTYRSLVHCYNSSVTLINSEFIGNSGSDNGGVSVDGSNLLIDSCSFRQNQGSS